MGSVMEYELECKKCSKKSVFSDFYYKSNEEYLQCQNCGWFRNVTIARNKNGKVTYTKEESGEYVKEFKSHIKEDGKREWTETTTNEFIEIPKGHFTTMGKKGGIGGNYTQEEEILNAIFYGYHKPVHKDNPINIAYYTKRTKNDKWRKFYVIRNGEICPNFQKRYDNYLAKQPNRS